MNIFKNLKSGFANIKTLFGIFLSEETNEDNYDLYINGSDQVLAQAAQELKQIEEEQEAKRLSFFGTDKIKKVTKQKPKEAHE